MILNPTATSDYTARSGSVTITEDVLFQCVSIPIRSDSTTETTNECFKFRISTAATIDGLSVQPNEAEICIVDRNCKFCNVDKLCNKVYQPMIICF